MFRTFTYQFETWQEYDAILNRLVEQGSIPVFVREQYFQVWEQGRPKLVGQATITTTVVA